MNLMKRQTYGFLVCATLATPKAKADVVRGVGHAYRSSLLSHVCELPGVIQEVTEQARKNAWDDALHNCKFFWTETLKTESIRTSCNKNMSGDYSLKITVHGEFECALYY